MKYLANFARTPTPQTHALSGGAIAPIERGGRAFVPARRESHHRKFTWDGT